MRDDNQILSVLGSGLSIFFDEFFISVCLDASNEDYSNSENLNSLKLLWEWVWFSG